MKKVFPSKLSVVASFYWLALYRTDKRLLRICYRYTAFKKSAITARGPDC